MATLLLSIIYLAFISLGLPDALLGGAWPVMQTELAVPYGFAGFVSMTITGGTILSSIVSSRVLKRFGTGPVTALSVALTALALFGFFLAPSFWWLFVAAIPLGLGAGAVDAGLNAYVAEHYESRHMSWLHSFWGVGALSGPLVVSAALAQGSSWRSAYLAIAVFQTALVLILIAALPLWGKVRRRTHGHQATQDTPHQPLFFPLGIPGVKPALVAFFTYCAIEASMGLWGASFLYKAKGLDPASAACWVSFFYASITLGRFLTGFVSYKLSNAKLIRGGGFIILAGVLLMLLPLPLPWVQAGFLCVGFGCAPIFPCMLHETPARFGSPHAQAIMGFQMAVAYIGSTFLPPLFGYIAAETKLTLLPAFLLTYVAVLMVCSARLERITAKARADSAPSSS